MFTQTVADTFIQKRHTREPVLLELSLLLLVYVDLELRVFLVLGADRRAAVRHARRLALHEARAVAHTGGASSGGHSDVQRLAHVVERDREITRVRHEETSSVSETTMSEAQRSACASTHLRGLLEPRELMSLGGRCARTPADWRVSERNGRLPASG